MSKDKPHCNGQWTTARFHSFIASALRGASKRWAPIADAKKRARTRRGWYRCAGCKAEVSATLPSVYKTGKRKGQPRRINNAVVDHILPIVDPATGFTSWDDFVARLFCEIQNLQVLCHACHQVKCQEERAQKRKNTK